MKNKELSIDEGFLKLQGILESLDEEGVGLEKSFQLYHEGLEIVKELNGRLEAAEQKLTIVNEKQEL